MKIDNYNCIHALNFRNTCMHIGHFYRALYRANFEKIQLILLNCYNLNMNNYTLIYGYIYSLRIFAFIILGFKNTLTLDFVL